MRTITTKLPEDMYERLEKLGSTIDRGKSYLVRKALEGFLEEVEDYFIAIHRLEQKNPRVSLEEIENDEVEDRI